MDIIEKALRAGEIAAQIKTLTTELELLFGGATSSVSVSEPAPTPTAEMTPRPEMTTAPAKRGPGRPPGSPNKPKTPAVAETTPPAETTTATTETTTTTTATTTVNDDIPWGGDDAKTDKPAAEMTAEVEVAPTEDPGF